MPQIIRSSDCGTNLRTLDKYVQLLKVKADARISLAFSRKPAIGLTVALNLTRLFLADNSFGVPGWLATWTWSGAHVA